ncbi:MAG: hypothetical protein KGZ63_00670 [Clostridiales bacterium]|nr:hypothetical protein [Clostridiales bacterium]
MLKMLLNGVVEWLDIGGVVDIVGAIVIAHQNLKLFFMRQACLLLGGL